MAIRNDRLVECGFCEKLKHKRSLICFQCGGMDYAAVIPQFIILVCLVTIGWVAGDMLKLY